MPSGLPWSSAFIRQLSDPELRSEFVADGVRLRIATAIKALREARGLSQVQFGEALGKPQSVVSRLEDPDYGRVSLQTLLDVAAALDLPLAVDFQSWDSWLRENHRINNESLLHPPFDSEVMIAQADNVEQGQHVDKVHHMSMAKPQVNMVVSNTSPTLRTQVYG